MTVYTKEITDDDIIEAIHNLIGDSDFDDLAWYARDLFWRKCISFIYRRQKR